MAIPRQRIRMPEGWLPTLLAGAMGRSLWSGPDIDRFERAFADLVGAGQAIATSSGRAGLRAILRALELEPGSEVICSAYGYPVVPHLARAMGFDVRFVDCELDTLGMDPDALRDAISDRTGAVIATHLFGVPCRIAEIAEIASAHGARLIEDCAHCLKATVGGRHVGTFGDAGYFSFETSKIVNTLGGGMIATRDADVAGRIRDDLVSEDRKTLSWLLKRLWKTAFEATVTSPVAFNLGVYPALRVLTREEGDDRFASGYQPDHFTLKGRTGQYTNYQARLGLRQLRTLDRRHDRRVANARRLHGALRDRVRLQRPDPGAEANFMLVTALVERRAEAGMRLLRRGIDTKHHYMRDCARALEVEQTFPNAVRAEAEVLHLPAHAELSAAQIDRVGSSVFEVLDALGSRPSPAEAGRIPEPAAGR